MTEFRVEIDARRVQRVLDEIVRAGQDLSRPLDAIGRFIVDEVRLGFRASKAPDGTPWEPLKSRDGKPLVDTGVLRDSLTHQVGGDAVEIGTDLTYAAIHQFGGKAGRGRKTTIPARPYLPTDGLPSDWEDELVDILRRHIAEALR